MSPGPRFPVYIPSRGRAEFALTPRALDYMGVPHKIIVEEFEYDAYARRYPADQLLVLPPHYVEDYDTCDEYGTTMPPGPGAARNYARDHAEAAGFPWHWTMDDNIQCFLRLHQNQRIPVGDGTCFAAMEDFVLRYTNIAMAGPNYFMFAPSRHKLPPYMANTRIYSCQLIRNDQPFRWRARYNDDTDLSLRLLKAGWATVLFNAFLQLKAPTQTIRGGSTDTIYANGTLKKSQMLVNLHPDVSRVAWRYSRWHHYVDYRRFKDNPPLLRDPDWRPPEENPYRLQRMMTNHHPYAGTNAVKARYLLPGSTAAGK